MNEVLEGEAGLVPDLYPRNSLSHSEDEVRLLAHSERCSGDAESRIKSAENGDEIASDEEVQAIEKFVRSEYSRRMPLEMRCIFGPEPGRRTPVEPSCIGASEGRWRQSNGDINRRFNPTARNSDIIVEIPYPPSTALAPGEVPGMR